MPNHCENTLTVTGPNLESFIKAVVKYDPEKDKDIIAILETQFPCPEKLYSAPSWGWRDWCIENWSTKWGDYDGEIYEDGVIHFLSAWRPPTKGIQKVSKLWPGHLFMLEYFEPGMMFCGRSSFLDGRISEDFYRDIPQIACPVCKNMNMYPLELHDFSILFECLECQEEREHFMEEEHEPA